MSHDDVLKFIRDNKIEMIDLKFLDLPGIWQHTTFPASRFSSSVVEEGFGFDGSSIRGFQEIHYSDMLLFPDLTSIRIDPVFETPTLSFICDVKDPVTREPFEKDPRFIARKAENYLKFTGVGDRAFFGPEAEFFILDDVRFDSGINFSYYRIDSKEGRWNSGREEGPNLAYKPRYKEGYFPAPPTDSLFSIRNEISGTLESLGIEVENHHHEVATGGQCEIDIRYAPLLYMGDNLMWFKYIIKNIARRHGKTATFMPKPLFGDNGSGLHLHQSIWKGEKNLFWGDLYGNLSQLALNYMAGILKHARALCAFTNPTVNSYRRLVPHYEAPTRLAYSVRNRSAAIRIPTYSLSPETRRIEFRTPDPSCNIYLAMAAILMAGMDGILNSMDPGPPMEKNIYNLPPEELENIPEVPYSLEMALDALRGDRDFLMKGGVFTEKIIDAWIRYKETEEIDRFRVRPTPTDFDLYFDI